MFNCQVHHLMEITLKVGWPGQFCRGWFSGRPSWSHTFYWKENNIRLRKKVEKHYIFFSKIDLEWNSSKNQVWPDDISLNMNGGHHSLCRDIVVVYWRLESKTFERDQKNVGLFQFDTGSYLLSGFPTEPQSIWRQIGNLSTWLPAYIVDVNISTGFKLESWLFLDRSYHHRLAWNFILCNF